MRPHTHVVLVTALMFGACGSEPSTEGLSSSLGESTIRLGTWNVRKLGHGDQTDFDAVASIIEANFDVIAITEVMQKATEGEFAPANAPGYHDLLAALERLAPGQWDALATMEARPNNTRGSSERYAIFYRRTQVRPCAGWTELLYVADYDGGTIAEGEMPLDLWIREPAFGCFEAGELDFVLAAWHASYGSVPKTRQEAYHLTRVFEAMREAVPGEEDFIIAGDFNLTVDQLAVATREWPAEYADVRDRTVDQGTTIRREGTLTHRAFDHLCVRSNEATNEMIGNAEPLHVYAGSEPGTDFYWEVSDHLPIMVELDITLPDDDGPERVRTADLIVAGAQLSEREVAPGQRIVAQATVYNAGLGDAPPSQLEYVLSTDSLLDASDRYLNYDRVDALVSGEHGPETANLRIPSVPDGEYWVLVVADANHDVDELDESNGTTALPLRVVTAASGADLVLEDVRLARDSARPGEQVGISLLVRNAGIDAAGDSRIKYFFSTDATFDPSDVYRSYDRVGGLVPGDAGAEDANVRVPADAAPGVYYILAVADVDGVIPESDENNVVALPITVLSL